MYCKNICPFYARDMDLCDVGYGYISPHHVEVMVRHCMSQHEDCAKYQELATRQPHGSNGRDKGGGDSGKRSGDVPTGGLTFPLSLDREVATAILHQIRTPLTSIRSFTEILLSYPIDDPDASREFLRIIRGEAKRLARTVDRMFGVAETPSPDAAPKSPVGGAKTRRRLRPEVAID